MIEAVISVSPAQGWVRSLIEKHPATVRILDCKSIQQGEGVRELFEILAPSGESEKIVDALKGHSYVYDVEAIFSKSGQIHGALKTHRCTACRAFADSDCFLISASTKTDGDLEWIVLGNEGSLKALYRKLKTLGVVFRIVQTSPVADEEILTRRQEEILQIALEKGYFDYPKKIGLKKLSSLLETSTVTLAEILRRGQKRLLMDHFKGRASVLSRQDKIRA